jgi:uncharacterized membrane protein
VVETLARWVEWIALVVEAAAVLIIAFGATQALAFVFDPRQRPTLGRKRLAWLNFARWLVFALEFELAADIIRTAITPTWDDIGQLGAIAVIRTFLSYFLERDIRDLAETVPAELSSGTGGAPIDRAQA